MSGKPLILVADDEPGCRLALKYLLSGDYDLAYAENGQQAVEQAKAHAPNLILMDIRMPELNGWEAIMRIRASGDSVPIIVLTGYPNPVDESKAGELGVAGYISKPYDLALVQQTVREHIGGSRDL